MALAHAGGPYLGTPGVVRCSRSRFVVISATAWSSSRAYPAMVCASPSSAKVRPVFWPLVPRFRSRRTSPWLEPAPPNTSRPWQGGSRPAKELRVSFRHSFRVPFRWPDGRFRDSFFCRPLVARNNRSGGYSATPVGALSPLIGGGTNRPVNIAGQPLLPPPTGVPWNLLFHGANLQCFNL